MQMYKYAREICTYLCVYVSMCAHDSLSSSPHLGGLSYNSCTGGTRFLPKYLFGNAALLALLVCLRTCASIFTCCRNGRYHHHTPRYYLGTKVFICTFEVFVVLCVVANLVLLGVFTFSMSAQELPFSGQVFCPMQYIYVYYTMTVTYMFLQYFITCTYCPVSSAACLAAQIVSAKDVYMDEIMCIRCDVFIFVLSSMTFH